MSIGITDGAAFELRDEARGVVQMINVELARGSVRDARGSVILPSYVQSILETLDSFGGIYIAMFLFAMLSGVFVLASSEAAMIALGAASSYGTPKLILLAVITALGQSVTHALMFWSGRGLAKAGAAGRPKLEARLAKARAIGARWEKSELLLIALGATVGIPPQVLVALLAGVIGIRFRTFASIDVAGRIARFVTIVLVAHLAN